MNRKVVFIITGIVIVLALGIFMIQQYNLEKYYTEQRERIALFFDYNYKDITSITFTGVGKNPMGTMVFDGYFNDDDDEIFTASILSHEESFEYHSAVDGKFNDKHLKREELDGELIPVSDILKEQEGKSEENQ